MANVDKLHLRLGDLMPNGAHPVWVQYGLSDSSDLHEMPGTDEFTWTHEDWYFGGSDVTEHYQWCAWPRVRDQWLSGVTTYVANTSAPVPGNEVFRLEFHDNGASMIIGPNGDQLPAVFSNMAMGDVIEFASVEWYGYYNAGGDIGPDEENWYAIGTIRCEGLVTKRLYPEPHDDVEKVYDGSFFDLNDTNMFPRSVPCYLEDGTPCGSVEVTYTSNGDKNVVNPPHKITAHYTLGDNMSEEFVLGRAYQTFNAKITPAPVEVCFRCCPSEKYYYDGCPVERSVDYSLRGVLPGDTVTLSCSPTTPPPHTEPGLYEDTFTFSLGGKDSRNYQLAEGSTDATAQLNIAPCPLYPPGCLESVGGSEEPLPTCDDSAGCPDLTSYDPSIVCITEVAPVRLSGDYEKDGIVYKVYNGNPFMCNGETVADCYDGGEILLTTSDCFSIKLVSHVGGSEFKKDVGSYTVSVSYQIDYGGQNPDYFITVGHVEIPYCGFVSPCSCPSTCFAWTHDFRTTPDTQSATGVILCRYLYPEAEVEFGDECNPVVKNVSCCYLDDAETILSLSEKTQEEIDEIFSGGSGASGVFGTDGSGGCSGSISDAFVDGDDVHLNASAEKIGRCEEEEGKVKVRITYSLSGSDAHNYCLGRTSEERCLVFERKVTTPDFDDITVDYACKCFSFTDDFGLPTSMTCPACDGSAVTVYVSYPHSYSETGSDSNSSCIKDVGTYNTHASFTLSAEDSAAGYVLDKGLSTFKVIVEKAKISCPDLEFEDEVRWYSSEYYEANTPYRFAKNGATSGDYGGFVDLDDYPSEVFAGCEDEAKIKITYSPNIIGPACCSKGVTVTCELVEGADKFELVDKPCTKYFNFTIGKTKVTPPILPGTSFEFGKNGCNPIQLTSLVDPDSGDPYYPTSVSCPVIDSEGQVLADSATVHISYSPSEIGPDVTRQTVTATFSIEDETHCLVLQPSSARFNVEITKKQIPCSSLPTLEDPEPVDYTGRTHPSLSASDKKFHAGIEGCEATIERICKPTRYGPDAGTTPVSVTYKIIEGGKNYALEEGCKGSFNATINPVDIKEQLDALSYDDQGKEYDQKVAKFEDQTVSLFSYSDPDSGIDYGYYGVLSFSPTQVGPNVGQYKVSVRLSRAYCVQKDHESGRQLSGQTNVGLGNFTYGGEDCSEWSSSFTYTITPKPVGVITTPVVTVGGQVSVDPTLSGVLPGDEVCVLWEAKGEPTEGGDDTLNIEIEYTLGCRDAHNYTIRDTSSGGGSGGSGGSSQSTTITSTVTVAKPRIVFEVMPFGTQKYSSTFGGEATKNGVSYSESFTIRFRAAVLPPNTNNIPSSRLIEQRIPYADVSWAKYGSKYSAYQNVLKSATFDGDDLGVSSLTARTASALDITETEDLGYSYYELTIYANTRQKDGEDVDIPHNLTLTAQDGTYSINGSSFSQQAKERSILLYPLLKTYVKVRPENGGLLQDSGSELTPVLAYEVAKVPYYNGMWNKALNRRVGERKQRAESGEFEYVADPGIYINNETGELERLELIGSTGSEVYCKRYVVCCETEVEDRDWSYSGYGSGPVVKHAGTNHLTFMANAGYDGNLSSIRDFQSAMGSGKMVCLYGEADIEIEPRLLKIDKDSVYIVKEFDGTSEFECRGNQFLSTFSGFENIVSDEEHPWIEASGFVGNDASLIDVVVSGTFCEKTIRRSGNGLEAMNDQMLMADGDGEEGDGEGGEPSPQPTEAGTLTKITLVCDSSSDPDTYCDVVQETSTSYKVVLDDHAGEWGGVMYRHREYQLGVRQSGGGESAWVYYLLVGFSGYRGEVNSSTLKNILLSDYIPVAIETGCAYPYAAIAYRYVRNMEVPGDVTSGEWGDYTLAGDTNNYYRLSPPADNALYTASNWRTSNVNCVSTYTISRRIVQVNYTAENMVPEQDGLEFSNDSATPVYRKQYDDTSIGLAGGGLVPLFSEGTGNDELTYYAQIELRSDGSVINSIGPQITSENGVLVTAEITKVISKQGDTVVNEDIALSNFDFRDPSDVDRAWSCSARFVIAVPDDFESTPIDLDEKNDDGTYKYLKDNSWFLSEDDRSIVYNGSVKDLETVNTKDFTIDGKNYYAVIGFTPDSVGPDARGYSVTAFVKQVFEKNTGGTDTECMRVGDACFRLNGNYYCFVDKYDKPWREVFWYEINKKEIRIKEGSLRISYAELRTNQLTFYATYTLDDGYSILPQDRAKIFPSGSFGVSGRWSMVDKGVCTFPNIRVLESPKPFLSGTYKLEVGLSLEGVGAGAYFFDSENQSKTTKVEVTIEDIVESWCQTGYSPSFSEIYQPEDEEHYNHDRVYSEVVFEKDGERTVPYKLIWRCTANSGMIPRNLGLLAYRPNGASYRMGGIGSDVNKSIIKEFNICPINYGEWTQKTPEPHWCDYAFCAPNTSSASTSHHLGYVEVGYGTPVTTVITGLQRFSDDPVNIDGKLFWEFRIPVDSDVNRVDYLQKDFLTGKAPLTVGTNTYVVEGLGKIAYDYEYKFLTGDRDGPTSSKRLNLSRDVVPVGSIADDEQDYDYDYTPSSVSAVYDKSVEVNFCLDYTEDGEDWEEKDMDVPALSDYLFYSDGWLKSVSVPDDDYEDGQTEILEYCDYADCYSFYASGVIEQPRGIVNYFLIDKKTTRATTDIDEGQDLTIAECWASVPHTLSNAFALINSSPYYGSFPAQICFDSSLANDDDSPVVCSGVQLSTEPTYTSSSSVKLGSQVYIDASRPYRKAVQNCVEVLEVDTDCLNWNKVVFEWPEGEDSGCGEAVSESAPENDASPSDTDTLNEYRMHMQSGLLDIYPGSMVVLKNVEFRVKSSSSTSSSSSSSSSSKKYYYPIAISAGSGFKALNCTFDSYACAVRYYGNAGSGAEHTFTCGNSTFSHCTFKNCGYVKVTDSEYSHFKAYGGCFYNDDQEQNVNTLDEDGEIQEVFYVDGPYRALDAGVYLDNCLFVNNNNIAVNMDPELCGAVNCTFIAPQKHALDVLRDPSDWVVAKDQSSGDEDQIPFGVYFKTIHNNENALGFSTNLVNCFVADYRYEKLSASLTEYSNLIPHHTTYLIPGYVDLCREDRLQDYYLVKEDFAGVPYQVTIDTVFGLVWGEYNEFSNEFKTISDWGSKTSDEGWYNFRTNYLTNKHEPAVGLSGSVIDRGDNAYVRTQLDLKGNLRVRHNTVDLGCYEYASHEFGICGFTDKSAYPSVYQYTDKYGDHFLIRAYCGEVKNEDGVGELSGNPVLYCNGRELVVLSYIPDSGGFWQAEVVLKPDTRVLGNYIPERKVKLPYKLHISCVTDYGEVDSKVHYFVSLVYNEENMKSVFARKTRDYSLFSHYTPDDERERKIIDCLSLVFDEAGLGKDKDGKSTGGVELNDDQLYTERNLVIDANYDSAVDVDEEEAHADYITIVNGSKFVTLKNGKSWLEKEKKADRYVVSTNRDIEEDGIYTRYYECDTKVGLTPVSLFAYGTTVAEGDNTKPIPLTISPMNVEVEQKQYDGTSVASVTVRGVDGIKFGDDVTIYGVGEYRDAYDQPMDITGTWNVAVSYKLCGDQAGKYVLVPASDVIQSQVIDKRGLVPVIQVHDKTYDSTTEVRFTAPEPYPGTDYYIIHGVNGEDICYDITEAGLVDKNAGDRKKVIFKYAFVEEYNSGMIQRLYNIPDTETYIKVERRQLGIREDGMSAANKSYDDNDYPASRIAVVTVDQSYVFAVGDDNQPISVYAGDVVEVKGWGRFQSYEDGTQTVNAEEVGSHPVNVVYSVEGLDANNYIAPERDTTTAEITGTGPFMYWIAYSQDI